MTELEIWKNLFDKANEIVNPQDISEKIFVGSVGAAILTASGTIYTGINVDTACSMGYCAERNAIGTMLLNREHQIVKVVAVRRGEVTLPCGVCREFMMQLDRELSPEIEILVNINPLKTLKLKELLPHYWD